MIRASFRSPGRAPFDEYRRMAIQRMERAALRATARAAREAKAEIRSAMSGARLGRLGFAIGSGSDLEKNGRAFRFGNQGFSASGWLFVRSRSERTLGTIAAYSEGADIKPVRGRWLWIATDEIPRRAGKYRMTPELYRSSGLEQKIGPLVVVRGINGYPLLVVRNVGVNAAGIAGKAKRLKKNGQPRVGQRLKPFLVAFYAIPSTSRAARFSPRQILSSAARRLPGYFQEAFF